MAARKKKRESNYPGPTIQSLFGTWEGQDAYVVGTSWSMQGFRWELLRGRNTIALNNAAVVVPEPIIHLYADTAIAKRYKRHKYSDRTTIVCQGGATTDHKKYGLTGKPRVALFRNRGETKHIKPKDQQLFVSRTVATGGIMLAWKLGARRVFLLGIDACRPAASEDYYYDKSSKKRDVRKKREKPIVGGVEQEGRHIHWCKNMDTLKLWFASQKDGGVYSDRWPGSGVFNLSSISAIETWEKVPATTVFEEDPWCQ